MAVHVKVYKGILPTKQWLSERGVQILSKQVLVGTVPQLTPCVAGSARSVIDAGQLMDEIEYAASYVDEIEHEFNRFEKLNFRPG